MINLIAVVALDGAIGKDNKMLWKISEDLQYYKARTIDNIVVVGRKTYESLPKIALKNRKYIVVTNNNPNLSKYGLDSSKLLLNAILSEINLTNNEKNSCVYIGGGQSIYEQLIDYCDYAYITWIGRKYPDADTYFPIKELHSKYELISESDWIESDGDTPSYKFSTYKRII